MKWLRTLCNFLFGTRESAPVLGQPPEPEAPQRGFELYGKFPLRDGDILVRELEKLGLAFEVQLDDGITEVDFRFGSSGEKASMTLFVEPANREILDRIVQLHFHRTSWSTPPGET